MSDPDMTPLCEATLDQIKDQLRSRYGAGMFALDDGPEEQMVWNAWPTWQRALGLVAGADVIFRERFRKCREVEMEDGEECEP